ncbi:hypothetical protein GCM10028803_26750 [Larkinella knui]|nr:class I SAM-dependent methyltransferase [Larkinella knui]
MAPHPRVDDGFDGVAPFYDALSRLVFGNSLRNAQAHWLHQVPEGAAILVFGGGTGWLLSRILTDCKPRKVIYIDASPVMISLSRKKVNNDSRVDFRVGTQTALLANDRVDILFTPFILDLFTDNQLKNSLLPHLLPCLVTNGFWFCCDFVEPTRWWHRLLLWSQYRFFRTLSHIQADHLPNWLPLLNSLSNLRLGEIRSFYGGMVASGFWQKVASPENDRIRPDQ